MSDGIFQKSLQDLIKGIRSHKRDASAYISQQIAEIKAELRSTDVSIKAEAVRKLTYLQMIGYNVSWASFGIVEVMSQPRFSYKRIGCMAANQSFNDQTDVILLTTNLFKKDFSTASNNQYELGVSINCLANIATHDLARDCIADLVGLMNHTRPYVRKKAVLAMYKLYIKYPQGLRLTFEKLKERLDDSDPAVVSTAVNVICELANKNPRNYLAMAPKFFRLLTTSSNNWMLIKVVKLLGSLVSEEPRLARKLLEPLATILQNTGAKSLQYECIATITEALPYTRREDGTDSKSAPLVVKLCSDYLRGFVVDNDQNLKYLGLVGLVNLMKSHPRSVVEHRELVLRCLNDDDVTIRTRALELLAGIVSRKSLVDLVHHLLEHVKLSEGSYRDELISKILYMCSKEKYSLVTDFAWYVGVLQKMAVMQGSKHGKEVSNQLIEIALRVDSVRPFAVECMLGMVLNEHLILGQARATVAEALKAAAWIIGEYATIVTAIAHDVAPDDAEEDEGSVFWLEGPNGDEVRSAWRGQPLHQMVLTALLHPRATNLPPHAQAAFVQAAMKTFIRGCIDCDENIVAVLVGVVRSRLGIFLQSVNIEVQERSTTFRQLMASLGILSLTWKADLDANIAQLKEREGGSQSQTTTEQLLFLAAAIPSDAPTTTQAVDLAGAKACKAHIGMLSAIVAEGFYAVHSKAQKRVPVPEGLDIRRPIDSSALAALRALPVPELQSLASLTFVTVAHTPSAPYFNAFEKDFNRSASRDEDEAKIAKLTATWGDDGDSVRASAMSKSGVYEPVKNPESNLFYLSGSKGNQSGTGTSLAQSLADAFEDTGKRGKKKDKAGKSKRRPKADVEVDVREMLPANAVASDDEESPSKHRSKKRSQRRAEEGLDSVDLTTPLRADEVFTVLKHREVEAPKANSDHLGTVTEPREAVGLVDADVAKKSKKGKDKEGKKHKGKEKEKKSKTRSPTEENHETVKSKKDRHPAPSAAVGDLLDLGTEIFVPSVVSSVVSDSSSKPKKPKTAVSPANNVEDPTMGVFSPHVVDTDGFEMLISKSSSKWASGSVSLRYNADQKAKMAFKAIATRLRAHQVDTEHSKSCSFCAKHVSANGFLFVLAKASSKDGGIINADIKCLMPSKHDSQAAVDAVIASLSSLSLV